MAVFTLHYLPSIAFFQQLLLHPAVVIEQYDSFQKSTFRNKTAIATANGKLSLSVPVEGGRNNRMLYKEVQIATTENWQHKHWLAIVSAYQNAPFFDYYCDAFYPFFHRPQSSLFSLNLALFRELCRLLKIENNLSFTSDYVGSDAVFLDKENTLLLQPENKRYIQVFEEKNGFIPHLSALDLLFNEGNKSKDYLLDTL